MRARVKRAVWCRWMHRLRLRESTSMVTAAGGGWELKMSGGASRRFCRACRGRWYAGRAARRGLGL